MGASPRSGRDEVVRQALGHADALYGFACWLSADLVEAEDLVQETFSRAIGAADRCEPGTNIKAWLFRLLREAHIDRRRRRQNKPTELRDDLGKAPEPEILPDEGAIDRLRSSSPEDVSAAVRALSEDYRSVLLLDLEGLTDTELADILGCSAGTVKSLLSRARAELRSHLWDHRT